MMNFGPPVPYQKSGGIMPQESEWPILFVLAFALAASPVVLVLLFSGWLIEHGVPIGFLKALFFIGLAGSLFFGLPTGRKRYLLTTVLCVVSLFFVGIGATGAVAAHMRSAAAAPTRACQSAAPGMKVLHVYPGHGFVGCEMRGPHTDRILIGIGGAEGYAAWAASDQWLSAEQWSRKGVNPLVAQEVINNLPLTERLK